MKERRMLILVVEDNSTTQRALQVILESLGYETDYAANGYGALTRMAIRKPRMIVADYLMPAMDGLAFAREVRKVPEWQEIPIIFTTAISHVELGSVLKEITTLKNVYFLHKPFDPDDLIRLIYRLRAEHPSWPVPTPKSHFPGDRIAVSKDNNTTSLTGNETNPLP